ncbi:endonuclease MutS2 [Sulfurihydrogenibium sp.]|jgi:DNA mismatch repair protein MutS2|uniref:endonuclease MutS2 n=1 Tax=Sulfurihydrogenibium sp. TaxID=2053621 RepID=UPI0026289C96|nr:endonuclease MutS2 [Sulfurihydrogenibium sp.]
MRERDLESLEYRKFLNLLSSYTHNEITKNKINNLKPITNREFLEKEIAKASEFESIFLKEGYFPLSEFPDITQAINLAKVEDSILSPREIFEIGEILRVVKNVKSFLSNHTLNHLKKLFQNLTPLRELEKFITDSIDSDFTVKDSASKDLARIRKEIKEVEKLINNQLEKILNNPNYQDAIQEKLITLRRDRFVIPVKYNFSHRIKGIIQDRSSSGNTVYVEPFEVVPLNNKLTDLKLQENLEIRKILKFLTDIIRTKINFISNSFDALIEFDILYTKAKFSKAFNCRFPQIGESYQLYNAKHPIFLLKEKPFIPIDILLDEKRGLVITGPNTGGKTVALKTAGLLSLIFQSAIAIPVDEGSKIPIFNGIFIDIGDYQSIEENLSTYSAHIKNIKEMLDLADKNSLFLFDELIPGTDPDFASAIGIAILDYVKEKNIRVIATTHLKKIKTYVLNNDYFKIATVGFDKETLTPTYKIYYNAVGESMAFYIAQKLNLQEEIIEKAKSLISKDLLNFEELASKFSALISEYEEKIKEINQLKQQLELEKAKYENLAKQLEKDKKEKWKESLKEIQDFVEKIRQEGYEVLKEVKERQTGAPLEKFVKEKKEIKIKTEEETKAEEIKEGDVVRIKGKTQEGTVIAIREDKANVNFGGIKIWLPLNQLEKRLQKEEKTTFKITKSKTDITTSINLIGKTKEEAIKELEKYIDKVILEGYTTFKIIHGYGTGVLRNAVREYLDKLPFKLKYEDAPYYEGGLGVTIVRFEE